MSVGELCIREVVITERDAPILEAARRMRDFNVGDLIVVERKGDRNVPVGIITDRDIVVNVLAKEKDPATTRVADALTSDLMTAREHDNLYDIIHAMRSKGIRRVPVVDGGGYLTGILSVGDILEYLADELTTLSRLVVGQKEMSKIRNKGVY